MIAASDSIKFGEWTPDLGDFENPGALIVKNCTSQGDNYRPFGSAVETGSVALPTGMAIGGFAYRDAIGNTTLFAATRTKLYRLNGMNWVDATRTTGGDYTTGPDGFWFFRSFGNLVIATNYNDDIQCLDMGAGDTNFSKLASNSPRCRSFFFLKNYMVCIDTVDIDGARQYRVRWSPLANPRGDWTDIIDGADFQDIYDSDYAIVFGHELQDFAGLILGNSIWRMDYVGGDNIFTFARVIDKRGSLLPRSCIANGMSIFFLAEDGFCEFDGSQLIAIGNDKIDQWFYANFGQTYDYNLNAAIDPLKKNVLWPFPSIGAGGSCDLIMVFNWITRRWTYVEENTDIIFSFLSIGYTLEGLDAVSTNLDALPYSLDSRIWTGGKTILGCFTNNHKLAAFSGTPKTAVIQTPEVPLNPGGRAEVHALIPYIEGGTIQGALGYRPFTGQTLTWTPTVNRNSMTGDIDIEKNGGLFRAQFTISDAWIIANAMAFRARPAGDV